VQKTKLTQTCQRSKIRAAKILRVKMPSMDAILQAIPDLHVIHYFRDPRGVFLSRKQGETSSCQGSGEEGCLAMVKNLCVEMADDIELSAPLRSKYPGAFMTLRYEDVVLNPSKALGEMYGFMGERMEQKLLDWVNATMNAKDNNGYYGVRRKDGSSRKDQWRRALNASFIEKMNNIPECQTLFRKLRYELH
jgi:hypothetical protein